MNTPHPAAVSTIRVPMLVWRTLGGTRMVLTGPADLLEFLRHLPRPFAWLRAHGWTMESEGSAR